MYLGLEERIEKEDSVGMVRAGAYSVCRGLMHTPVEAAATELARGAVLVAASIARPRDSIRRLISAEPAALERVDCNLAQGGQCFVAWSVDAMARILEHWAQVCGTWV